jgi:hypothetical protein
MSHFGEVFIALCPLYPIHSLMRSLTTLREYRRSTRVPLKVVIVIQGDDENRTCDGETIVVNLQGALIASGIALSTGMAISIHVYLTDKRAAARVVYIDSKNPMHCGIEFDEPRNIWGVPLPPNDWVERVNSETAIEPREAPSKVTGEKEARCPYCVVDGDLHPMRLLSHERLICEKCGHIVFPNDSAFRCPCQKCLQIHFSPRVRGLRGGKPSV